MPRSESLTESLETELVPFPAHWIFGRPMQENNGRLSSCRCTVRSWVAGRVNAIGVREIGPTVKLGGPTITAAECTHNGGPHGAFSGTN